jgi:hypothetical protein
MRILYDEILRRFPEVRPSLSDGEEDLPYLMMGHVASWAQRLSPTEINTEAIARVQAFIRWCEEQPRGETAADDILTVLVVGFYEKLFETEDTRALLPKFVAKEDFIKNAEYLKTWVGAEKYEQATKHFQ